MHTFPINASIQVLPIATPEHPYEWVDEAIAVIQKSGLKFEVTPFQTVIEGPYQQVMEVIHQIQEQLQQRGCAEWITQIQLHIRSGRPVTADEKTGAHR